MEYILQNGIKWFSFIDNRKLMAGVSTRIGGYSVGNYSGLNVGINTADSASTIKKNRDLLFSTVSP